MSVTITGESGAVRHQYLVAATLGPWTLRNGRLTAKMVSQHAIYLARRPFQLDLGIGRHRHIWRTIEPKIAGGVLLVDDHAVVRFGIAQLINKQPDLDVCGEEEDASKALTAIETLKPDPGSMARKSSPRPAQKSWDSSWTTVCGTKSTWPELPRRGSPPP